MLDVIESLENSKEFKEFKKENPKSYLCSAFFVVGRSPDEAKKQVNYAMSDSSYEVMSFDISTSGKIVAQKLDSMKKETLHRISKEDVSVTIDQLAANIEAETKRKFDKIIAVLQDLNGVLIWNVTCMDGFVLHRYHIDAKSGKVEKMKDIKLQDMMRVEKKTPDYIQ